MANDDSEECRKKILLEIDSAIKTAILEHSHDGILSSGATQGVCNVIEALFIHGLKDAFFVKNSRHSRYPEPNFWPFVSRFVHKSVRGQIAASKQIRSEIGKSRAWIRIVLNEGVFESHLRALSKEQHQLRVFYTKEAFLRDEDKVESLLGYLKALSVPSKVMISAPFNSTFLNTWTPFPLILAGLMSGKLNRGAALPPASPSSLGVTPRRENSSNSLEVEEDEPELALNAGDLLNESSTDTSLFAAGESPLFAQSPEPETGDEDERSSVYSHPSMLDGGIGGGVPFRPNFISLLSSTPEHSVLLSNSALVALPHEEQTSEVIVHRKRAVRIRRHSRCSSREGDRVLEEARNASSSSSSQSESGTNAGGGSEQEVRRKLLGLIAADHSGQHENASEIILADTPPFTLRYENTIAERGSEEKRQNVGGEEKEAPLTDDDKMKAKATSLYVAGGGGGGIAIEGKTMEFETFLMEGEENDSKGLAISGAVRNRVAEKTENEEVFATSLQEELNAAGFGELVDELCNTVRLPSMPVTPTTEVPLYLPPQSEDLPCCSSSSAGTDYSGPAMLMNFNAELMIKTVEGALPIVPNGDLPVFDDDEPANVGDTRSVTPTTETPRPEILERTQELPFTSLKIESHTNAEGDDSLVGRQPNRQGQTEQLNLEFLFSIAREKGLDEQEFRCPSCRKSIGGTSFGLARLCYLDGHQYCEECSPNGVESLIPARVILNWDTKPRNISKKSKELLISISSRPIFHIDQLNPELYAHSRQLKRVEQLRRKLSLVAMYLLNCKQSVAEDIKKRLWPHDYLYKDIHLFSLEDLEDTISGALEKRLNSIVTFAVNHVSACALCLQKGFVCELCSSKRVIYPFQIEIVERCPTCFSVFHKECVKKREGDCPRCLRRRKHSSSANLNIKSPTSSFSISSPTPSHVPLPSI